jgi:hypothetical protein
MTRRALGLLMAGGLLFARPAYEDEITKWRLDREAALKADGGWLSVAGLFWLHEGANPFGKEASNAVTLSSLHRPRFAADSAPAPESGSFQRCPLHPYGSRQAELGLLHARGA